jgi:ribonucleoside-diphosphate reductase alpha chain
LIPNNNTGEYMNKFQRIEGRSWPGLPKISQDMYEKTYFLKNESYDDWTNRMSNTYANNPEQAERIKTYLHNYWFHPSTPVSSNGGTTRGLPISCYVGDVEDSKTGIFGSWTESGWLGSQAGGIGRWWGDVREMGANVGEHGGKSSGIIPFMCVDGALTRAVSQGDIRRMSQADYLDVSHPEIVEFLEIRKPTGDQSRKDQDLHHGISISDSFMKAVINNEMWDLVSPYSKTVVESVKAQDIWTSILDMRATTGEPYLFFYDNVNKLAPAEYKQLGLDIHLSNLCTEIMLNTSPTKTNVCCLASVNLEYYDEYKHNLGLFIADCTDFLDNVLQDFIDKTEGHPGFVNARAAAIEERALGLGVMGFHSYLQSKLIPFESGMAKSINIGIFKAIKEASDKHQENLANAGHICPMSKACGTKRRNIVTLAVAPTMSISNLCNMASSGIEPWIDNSFSKKLKQGTYTVKNRYLDPIIQDYAKNNEDLIEAIWTDIKKHKGSVQHLEWMSQDLKDVFKTAFEIDQKWVIEHAADRTPYIDQGQSTNLFIPGNSHVQLISDLHILAWKKGLKSLYYMRSTNPNSAKSSANTRKQINTDKHTSGTDPFDLGCLGCQ